MPIHETLDQLRRQQPLSRQTARSLFDKILEGSLDDAQIGAALALLASRTPTVDELVGAAQAMRARMKKVSTPDSPAIRVIDTCGTGGAPKTFNVSTAAAFVVAGIEPPSTTGVERLIVAKHGNRSRTGRGSAEVIAALGIDLDATPDHQAEQLDRCGVCFCFAVNHHPAVRHAVGPRRSLGFPTLFNLTGPLTNPAGATRQVLGVYRPDLVGLIAGALRELGAEHAMVVHTLRDDGPGLDELAPIGAASIVHATPEGLRHETLHAEQVGFAMRSFDELVIEGVPEAAEMIRSVLAGEPGPALDAVLLTAAAGAIVGGIAESWEDALPLARRSIESGKAADALRELANA